MKKKLAILAAIAVAILIWYVRDTYTSPFKVGESVPNFELSELKNGRVSLNDFRGHPVLIHFWATWCWQCAKEMPLLNDVEKNIPGLKVLAISEDEGGFDAVWKFFGNQTPNYLVLLDADGSVANSYKSYKVPETFLVDKDGKFLHRFLGSINWKSPKVVDFIKEKTKN